MPKICPFLSTKVIELKEGMQGEKILEVPCIQERCFFWTGTTCVFIDKSSYVKLGSSIDKGFSEVRDAVEVIKKDIEVTNQKVIQAMEEQMHNLTNKVGEGIDKFQSVNQEMGKIEHAVRESIQKIHQILEKSNEIQSERGEETRKFIQEIGQLIKVLNSHFQKWEIMRKEELKSLHYEKALLFYVRGEYEPAKEELEKIEEMDIPASLLYSSSLSKIGEREQAKEILNKLLEKREDINEVYNNLGVLYMEEGKLEESLQLFEKGKSFSRQGLDYPELLYNMAHCLYKMGRIQEALKTWEETLKIDPTFYKAKEALEKYSQGA